MTKELTYEIEEKLMEVWDAGYMQGVSDAANGAVILPVEDKHCGEYGRFGCTPSKVLNVSCYLRKCVDEVLHTN